MRIIFMQNMGHCRKVSFMLVLLFCFLLTLQLAKVILPTFDQDYVSDVNIEDYDQDENVTTMMLPCVKPECDRDKCVIYTKSEWPLNNSVQHGSKSNIKCSKGYTMQILPHKHQRFRLDRAKAICLNGSFYPSIKLFRSLLIYRFDYVICEQNQRWMYVVHSVLSWLILVYALNFYAAFGITISIAGVGLHYNSLRRLLLFTSSRWTWPLFFGGRFLNSIFLPNDKSRMDIAVSANDRNKVWTLLECARLDNDELEIGLAFVMKQFNYDQDLETLTKCYDKPYLNYDLQPARHVCKLSQVFDKVWMYIQGQNNVQRKSPFSSFITHCADKHYIICPARAKEAIGKFKASRFFDINFPNSNLAVAIEKCSVDFCRALLEAGADVNSSFPGGKRAIHVAIELNCVEKVLLLLEYGVDLDMPWHRRLWNSTDDQIPTALHYAQNLNRRHICSLLRNEQDEVTQHPEYSAQIVLSADNTTVLELAEIASKRLDKDEYKREIRTIERELKKRLESVSNHFASNDNYKCFTFDAVLAGSMAEGTKIDQPDEFDFMCVLNQTDNLRLEASPFSSHHCQVICESNESGLIKVCQYSSRITSWFLQGETRKHRLDSAKFNSAFCDAFKCVLLACQSDITDGFENDSLVLERHHKFPRFFLTRKRKSAFSRLLTISVDLVPCFRFKFPQDHGSLLTEILFGTIDEKLYVVPKTPFAYDESLPISYNDFEHSAFSGEPSFIKEGYKLAKALRCKKVDGKFSTIWYPNSLRRKIHAPMDLDPEELITSYQLKTCVIMLLKREIQVKKASNKHLHIYFAREIYNVLKMSLANKTMCPYYQFLFPTSTPIFECQHGDLLYDDQLACCQLNSLRLEMTTTILNYLDKEIQNFSLETEDETEELVAVNVQLKRKIDEMNQFFDLNISRQLKVATNIRLMKHFFFSAIAEPRKNPTDSHHELKLKHNISKNTNCIFFMHLLHVMICMCLVVASARLRESTDSFSKPKPVQFIIVSLHTNAMMMYGLQATFMFLSAANLGKHMRWQCTRACLALAFIVVVLSSTLLVFPLFLTRQVSMTCDNIYFKCFLPALFIDIVVCMLFFCSAFAAYGAILALLDSIAAIPETRCVCGFSSFCCNCREAVKHINSAENVEDTDELIATTEL